MKKYGFIFAGILLTSLPSFAQNRLALGSSVFESNGILESYVLRVSKTNQTIDFQASFGYRNNSSVQLDTNVNFGFNIFEGENFKTFWGPRVGFYFNNNLDTSFERATTKILRLAPFYGCEYFLVENFSVGLTLAPTLEFDFTENAKDEFRGISNYASLNALIYF
ncbi:hypothetical protein IT568_08955 [bacterium]|nr:hypothetical protein [bacterium]